MEEGNIERNIEPDTGRLLNLGLLLILILSVIFLVSIYASKSLRVYTPPGAVVVEDPFKGLSIEARAGIVYDLRKDKILYEKNIDEVLPLASLTKVMTAVTALELVPNSSIVRINKEFLSEEGDSGLRAEEDWRLRDLLDLSLVVSSNDAAAAVSATIGSSYLEKEDFNLGRKEFVGYMNSTARDIGMKQSIFFNDTGLDLNTEKNGGYSSAREYVTLIRFALEKHPEILEATRFEEVNLTSLNNIRHNATNTNIALKNIPNIIGSKTGFTDIAGGNVMTVFDAGLNQPIAIVVLGSTYDGRFEDLTLLAETAQKAIQK